MKIIKLEIAHIQKIRELQQRGVALIGSAWVAFMIGIMNFISRIAYDYAMMTEWGQSLRPGGAYGTNASKGQQGM